MKDGRRWRNSERAYRFSALIEELHDTLALKTADDSQRAAQPEMIKALHTALDARRQRIVVSQNTVGAVKWTAILLQGLCTLVAIAMVHSDNRLTQAKPRWEPAVSVKRGQT